jgi:hypothetical protein
VLTFATNSHLWAKSPKGMMVEKSRAIPTDHLEDCQGSRSPALAALGEEAKDDYLLTNPTIRNAGGDAYPIYVGTSSNREAEWTSPTI